MSAGGAPMCLGIRAVFILQLEVTLLYQLYVPFIAGFGARQQPENGNVL